MKEKYFYVKPDNVTLELQKEKIYKINIEDIHALAVLATSLNPCDEKVESQGYARALYIYFSNNKNQKKFRYYFDRYKELTSNIFGVTILCFTIELCLLEKKFREEKIEESDINLYNEIREKCQNLLVFNNSQFEIITPNNI